MESYVKTILGSLTNDDEYKKELKRMQSMKKLWCRHKYNEEDRSGLNMTMDKCIIGRNI